MVQVRRKGRLKDIVITRGIINANMLHGRVTRDRIGIVKFSEFTEWTASKLKKEILSFGTIKGLVLDLRGNSGGHTEQARLIADLFMKGGIRIGVSRNRAGKIVDDIRTTEETPFETLPLVVLIDRKTASASELLVGALQDLKRAKVFGSEPSYGKAIAQVFQPFDDGSGMFLTECRYETPSGRSVHGVGINPDVTPKRSSGDYVLKGALEFLRHMQANLTN